MALLPTIHQVYNTYICPYLTILKLPFPVSYVCVYPPVTLAWAAAAHFLCWWLAAVVVVVELIGLACVVAVFVYIYT